MLHENMGMEFSYKYHYKWKIDFFWLKNKKINLVITIFLKTFGISPD